MDNLVWCYKCRVKKSPESYTLDHTRKSGLRVYCKLCVRQYYLDNKEKLDNYRRDWARKKRGTYNKYYREYWARKKRELDERAVTESYSSL